MDITSDNFHLMENVATTLDYLAIYASWSKLKCPLDKFQLGRTLDTIVLQQRSYVECKTLARNSGCFV